MLEDAFFAMTKELKGTYAILALYGGEPGKILAARKDAPLVMALAKGQILSVVTSCPLAICKKGNLS